MSNGMNSVAVLQGQAPSPVISDGDHPNRRRLGKITKEAVLLLTFVGVYELLRSDMVQDGSQATVHALAIVRVESALGLFHEQAFQQLFLRAPSVVKVCNLYYGGTHFVVPAVGLWWLALRHPQQYLRARTALGVITIAAFTIFWAFPVAPPRLLPARFGIVDTLVTFQQSGHLEHSLVDSAGDIYAATPSLHVAWALWCTLALYPVVRNSIVRFLLVAYPVLTTVVVVATGNHFIIDALSGALLAGLVWTVLPKVRSQKTSTDRPVRSLDRSSGVVRHRPPGEWVSTDSMPAALAGVAGSGSRDSVTRPPFDPEGGRHEERQATPQANPVISVAHPPLLRS